MKGFGGLLAVIGVILIILAIVHYFAFQSFTPFPHTTIIVGAVGAILLIIGAVMAQAGGKKA